MDVTRTNPPPKRARAKGIVKAPPVAKPARKTLTAPRKKSTVAAVSIPAPQSAAPTDLQGEIQKTAFCLAAERNFAPGHELDDWLEAERRVKAPHSA